MTTSAKSSIPSLNGTFSEEEINTSLTEAGLLPDRAKAVVELYIEQGSWAAVKEEWHERRVHDRGSRGSAQQIFRVLKRRLQTGGADLLPMSALHRLIEESPTSQAEAQLLYFYLIRNDNLFRFALHEVLRRQGIDQDEWLLSTDSIASLLSDYEYEDGENLEYADSTLRRWAQGFRSVLRDIGVLEGPYDDTGTVPAVDEPPAHLSALYSWEKEGKGWIERPIGWFYLFQPLTHQDLLLDRLRSDSRWTTTRLHGERMVLPAGSDGTPD